MDFFDYKYQSNIAFQNNAWLDIAEKGVSLPKS